MHQQKLLFLISKMARKTSCTIHINMNPSCNQERKFIKLTKDPTNVISKKDMKKSSKIRNNLTSFTHIVMQIVP